MSEIKVSPVARFRLERNGQGARDALELLRFRAVLGEGERRPRGDGLVRVGHTAVMRQVMMVSGLVVLAQVGIVLEQLGFEQRLEIVGKGAVFAGRSDGDLDESHPADG